MAIAGLVIGIIGLLGAALTWVAILSAGNAVRNAVTQATGRAAVGQPLAIEQADGIRSITVTRVEHPVPAPSEFETPSAGKEFAVADVNVCAGSAGAQEAPTLLWSLVFPDGTTVDRTLFAAKKPSVDQINALAPNQCAQGFVTFEITPGTSPKAVRYRSSAFRSYEWTL